MKQFAGLLVCVAALTGCAVPTLQAPNSAAHAGEFSTWKDFKLPGKQVTVYDPLLLDGAWVVRAKSSAAASMFRRLISISANELGSVAFDWRVERLIEHADLTDADSADSPVRVVLAFDGNHDKLSPKTRMMFELAEALTGEAPPYATLMYVWDNKASIEAIVPGGRSDRIRKIVVDSGPAHTGQWRSHRRDIAADFHRAFGEAPGALIGIALLTDTDNTRSATEAYYRGVKLIDAAGHGR